MPPLIAALLFGSFIAYVFWLDSKKHSKLSAALWIPLAWMFLAGSRFVSHWLKLSAPAGTDAQLDGSPVDRAVFGLLIAVGIVILVRRRVNWSRLIKQNAWIWFFFLFALVSLAWSDYPLLSFKRLFKAFGNVVMALVILTDRQPYVALGAVLRRLAFLTLPLSVLFIKYFPEYGRSYHMGKPLFSGVAIQKNGLGQLCLLASLYFCWVELYRRQDKFNITVGPIGVPVTLVFFALIAWLMFMANSATSLACVIIGCGMLMLGKSRFIRASPQRIFTFTIAGALVFCLFNTTFDARGAVISALGRDDTLTTRVLMWQDLLSSVRHPFIGYGFEVFWATEAGRKVSANWVGLFQAHNGYLEMYLNLGYIGLFLLVAIIASGVRKARLRLNGDYAVALFQLACITVIILYNYTEASFRSINNIWLLLFLCVIDIAPRERETPSLSSVAPALRSVNPPFAHTKGRFRRRIRPSGRLRTRFRF